MEIKLWLQEKVDAEQEMIAQPETDETFICLGCFKTLLISAKGFNRCRRCEVSWTDDPQHYKTNGVY